MPPTQNFASNENSITTAAAATTTTTTTTTTPIPFDLHVGEVLWTVEGGPVGHAVPASPARAARRRERLVVHDAYEEGANNL